MLLFIQKPYQTKESSTNTGDDGGGGEFKYYLKATAVNLGYIYKPIKHI